MPIGDWPHQVLLASTSPRRHELLALLDLEFEVERPDVDEHCDPCEAPAQAAQRLAREKVESVRREKRDGVLIIAADTIVVQDNEILSKPEHASDAKSMLRRLRGRSHEVVTAIAVTGESDMLLHEDACTTQVQVREFTDHLLESYVATGDPMDKAGAYGIQNNQFRLATPVNGCLANVIGLPLCHLVRTLRRVNVHTSVDVPHICQMHIEYDCPVYESILSA